MNTAEWFARMEDALPEGYTIARKGEIERLTAENERLRSQLGHCPNTSDGRHEWMMYLVGPDGQRLGPGSSPAGHGAAAVFCQYCGAPKLPVEENRVVLSDQQSTLQES